MGGILIFDQLLLTLIDHVLYKVSSSGIECANLSPLRVQGLDSSECLFYAQRGINLIKLNGTDLSPACVKAHPFKVFQPTLWLVILDRLSISLFLLVIRYTSRCVCCRWGNRFRAGNWDDLRWSLLKITFSDLKLQWQMCENFNQLAEKGDAFGEVILIVRWQNWKCESRVGYFSKNIAIKWFSVGSVPWQWMRPDDNTV